jgi:hypothetical protein
MWTRFIWLQMVFSGEESHELSGYVRGGEFIDKLHDY